MVTWVYNNIPLLLEIVAVIFGVLYTVLMAQNKISCWIFGIIGSLLSVYIFVEYAKLYAEAVLYVFYVFMCFVACFLFMFICYFCFDNCEQQMSIVILGG